MLRRDRVTTVRALIAFAALAYASLVPAFETHAQQLASESNSSNHDWPMWGGSIDRNMVSFMEGLSLDFAPASEGNPAQNLVWSAQLGTQTYSPPAVAGGKVFIGTNNGAEYRPNHSGDRGCVLCFEESNGEFLWQLTRPKLESGRVNDWPQQGIVSVPCVEGDRLWVVTNRAELMCLDTEGFYDKENDGPFTSESDLEVKDADIVWSLDMIEELGVFPHNLASSSPVVHENMVFVITSNGVDGTHRNVPSPEAPSFIAVNKETGQVIWQDNSPSDKILHGQWSSPTIATVGGNSQVVMGGGDGWLYAFNADMGNLIWKFDLNPKESEWLLGGRGTRNNVIGTPVFVDNSIVIAVGQDPEHGNGVGYLYRIDATQQGDISPQMPDGSDNPNSGMIWRFGGIDVDGDETGEPGREIFRRTLATASVANGLVFIPDFEGYAHCVDFETGERYWEHDLLAQSWSGFAVADGKAFLTDTDGTLTIMEANVTPVVLARKQFETSLYGHVVFANDRMFIADRQRLHVFSVKE